MRGGVLWVGIVIVLLGVASFLVWFEGRSSGTTPDVTTAVSPLPGPAALPAPRAVATNTSNRETQAAVRATAVPASAADFDEQALQLSAAYLRECGASTFAVLGGYGNDMHEFLGLTRTVNRVGISPAEALEHVDWAGSVSITWGDERKRCLDCEEEWRDFTGGGSVLMEVRHKNGAWKATAPNSTFVQLQPSWTCEWFQRAAAAPPQTAIETETAENN